MKVMRAMRRIFLLLVILAVATGAVLAYNGILYVHNTDDEVNLTIDKNKLEQETREAVEQTNEAGSRVRERIHKATRSGEERPATEPDKKAASEQDR